MMHVKQPSALHKPMMVEGSLTCGGLIQVDHFGAAHQGYCHAQSPLHAPTALTHMLLSIHELAAAEPYSLTTAQGYILQCC